jgi:hypothetical protein
MSRDQAPDLIILLFNPVLSSLRSASPGAMTDVQLWGVHAFSLPLVIWGGGLQQRRFISAGMFLCP